MFDRVNFDPTFKKRQKRSKKSTIIGMGEEKQAETEKTPKVARKVMLIVLFDIDRLVANSI